MNSQSREKPITGNHKQFCEDVCGKLLALCMVVGLKSLLSQQVRESERKAGQLGKARTLFSSTKTKWNLCWSLIMSTPKDAGHLQKKLVSLNIFATHATDPRIEKAEGGGFMGAREAMGLHATPCEQSEPECQ